MNQKERSLAFTLSPHHVHSPLSTEHMDEMDGSILHSSTVIYSANPPIDIDRISAGPAGNGTERVRV